MKKLCIVLLAMLLCLGTALAEADNLIANGGFAASDGDLPDGWRKDMWLTDIGVSLLSVDADGYDGACVTVENVDANDARYAQTVKVAPNAVYRLSGMIRAEGCDEDGYGATLSIQDVFVYTDGVYDTGGEWQAVELYGRTGPDQRELTVFARVGGYGSLSRGRASFDDISLVRVDEAPAGAVVYELYREKTTSAAASTTDDVPKRYTESWLLLTGCYALAVIAFVRKRDRAAEPLAPSRWKAAFLLGLLAALVLRLVLAARVPGYYTDVNCFYAWSERIFTLGPSRFYDPDYFCDYPPGYMLLLWLVAALRRLLGLDADSPTYLALLKLMPVLADLAAAALVLRVARRRMSERGAAMLALLVAFNPAAITTSAAWGQIDAMLALAVALCALDAADGRTVRALVWFGVGALLKPQAALFAPVGLAVIACGIFRAGDAGERRKRLRALGLGAAACVGLMYAAGLLFTFGRGRSFGETLTLPVTWLYGLYTQTVQGYRYVTMNTLNLHYLLGLNWASADEHPAAIAVAWTMFGCAYALCLWLTFKSALKPRRLFLIGGLLIALVCTFGPMIHERYIFPGMLLLALAFACERDVRLLISLTVMTAVLFMNEVLVLQGGMTAANYGHLQTSEDWLNRTLCAANLLNALFLGWTAWDLCVNDRVMPLAKLRRESVEAGTWTLAEAPGYKLNLRRAEVLAMAAVTLLYSALAFTNLGVTKAPQNPWIASQGGESVVFDLGQVETFRMTYYGGICNSPFAVELSNDGQNWTERCWAKYDQGEIFSWLWFVPQDETQNTLYGETVPTGDGSAWLTYPTINDPNPRQTARYVRLTANAAGLILYEVGFLDGEDRPLPVAGVSQSGQTQASASSAAALIDEQACVPALHSYLNSMYFDEIYHARTAYEHLHGLNAYEWTHPPLGKVLMMIGIQLFGMTPFGWRFMGALTGVLMLPLMYLLAKQLTHDARLSFVAMCLFALDAMHFTQTRIATIDSYAVFWIMLMYLFMFRYCQMSWNRESLGRTLVPLGLCGVTMGIAWATKWVGLYASAGLAVLFFWTVGRRVREMKHLRNRAQSLRSLVITLLFCVVFFLIIPALIYYFSYFWQLRPEGVRTFGDMLSGERVNEVIRLQKTILSYHSGLGGDRHYFRSPWYQWPVIWWPMWFYSGKDYMPEGMVSSISCMGNPAVWWFGLAALLFVVARMCWARRASRRYVMVVVGFASQFLPWVLVPRSTFIYHYFASVPFIILASTLLLEAIRRKSEQAFHITAGALLGASLVLFAGFYPLESGLPCPRAYAKYLRWFKWYNF